MFDIGFSELLLIIVIILLLFGPKKLPELARAMGEAVREFKDAMNAEKKPQPKKRKG